MNKLHVISVASLIAVFVLSACGSAEEVAECKSEEVFCVGLVTATGTINDQSSNQAAWAGVQQAEEELGAQIQYVESAKADDYAGNIDTLAETGYDLIVTVGFALGEATNSAAKKHPDVKFIGVDQFQTETMENVTGLNFHEDQAGFLVGALASVMSKSQNIGAVCAANVIPSMWRFGEGYKAGAEYADQLKGTPTEVTVVYHRNDDKALTDPEWGQTTAKTMIDQGADVIFGCGGTTGGGAITAAAETGAYVIGGDTDQYLAMPEAAPRLLTSAIKRITPNVFELIQFSHEGKFPSGNYFGDVGYAPYHDLEGEVPEAVKVMMQQIEAGLLDGSIHTNVPLTRK
jgi:basic membrane protein A and related proteins